MTKLGLKRLWAVALLAALCGLVWAAPAAAAAKISIVVDGQAVKTDADPRLVNGRVLVPLRVVSESMNAQVDYKDGVITITAKEGQVLRLREGSKEVEMTWLGASYNTDRLELESAVKLYNNRAFVPLRFVAENLGGTVEWQGDKRQVILTPGRYVDNSPAYVNAEGKSLHSLTRHSYMTMGGWLHGYWGHSQVGEAWKLLVEGRGRELPEPTVPYSRIYNMDWNYFYYLNEEIGFYTGEPVYDIHGDEDADYFFEIYGFCTLYDDGSVKAPGDNDGKYAIRDTKTGKWYALPAANYEAFQALEFPHERLLYNSVV